MYNHIRWQKLAILRPDQYIKNLFVFLPLFFAGEFVQTNLLLFCLITFSGFSLLASSVYIFNDINDADKDRLHPVKKERPLPNGEISVKFASVLGITCLLMAFGLALLVSKQVLLLFVAYAIINFFYTLWLKRFPIVDIVIISSGFLIRVLSGAASADVYLSNWMMAMTFFLSLFLALSKRREDVVMYNQSEIKARHVASIYKLPVLDGFLRGISVVVVLVYMAWTLSEDTMIRFESHYLVITSVFVVGGLARYFFLIHKEYLGSDPTRMIFKDRILQVILFLWSGILALLLYF